MRFGRVRPCGTRETPLPATVSLDAGEVLQYSTIQETLLTQSYSSNTAHSECDETAVKYFLVSSRRSSDVFRLLMRNQRMRALRAIDHVLRFPNALSSSAPADS